MSKIIYNISGRSFYQKTLGRKISEVISCWKNDNDIEVICGGDINSPNDNNIESNYGNSKHYNQNFRKRKFLEPLVHTISELKDIFHDRKMLNTLHSKFDKEDISMVWERSSRLHYAGYKYAKKREVPYVLEWKDNLLNYNYSLFKFYAKFIENYKNKNADFLVVESNVLKEELIKSGINKDKIFVAYNAVNAEEFIPSENNKLSYRNSINIKENITLVGYLGSYAFYHDTKRLILAANIIKKKNILDIKFLLVGSGKEYKECYDLAKELNLINHLIIFKEGVDKEEVPNILSAIDITVLPGSTDIICPIKVFEYMATESLVLVPNHESNKEVIKDKINGLLFQAFDEEDLANKIIESALNKDASLIMAKNARKSVQEQYTWENTWGRVMKEILEKSKLSD